MPSRKSLTTLSLALALSHFPGFSDSARAVTISTPTVDSRVVSFSCDAGAGQLVTVQSSPIFPLQWSDDSYQLGTGAPLRFSTPLTNGQRFFRVRVTPYHPLQLSPSSPVLATGPVSLPDAIVGAPYSFQIVPALTGLPPYIMSVNGSPSTGISLVVSGTQTGNAYVQVASNGAGLVAGQRRQFAVSVVDALNTTNTLSYDLRVVAPPPQIASSLVVLKAGKFFTGPLVATNGTPPFVWQSISGSMPTGFSLSADGTLSGTPSADDAELFETGRFTNLIQVADSFTDRLTGAPAPRVATNTVVQLVRLSYSQNIWPSRPDGPTLNGVCLFCHGSGFPPDMANPSATAIIGVQSQNNSCPGRVYITPGSPANSLIFEKLSGPDCGQRMPYGGPYFDSTQLGRVQRWILELGPADTD
jgi:hypothetical protein